MTLTEIIDGALILTNIPMVQLIFGASMIAGVFGAIASVVRSFNKSD